MTLIGGYKIIEKELGAEAAMAIKAELSVHEKLDVCSSCQGHNITHFGFLLADDGLGFLYVLCQKCNESDGHFKALEDFKRRMKTRKIATFNRN